jgi:hypothetical protein
MQHKQHVWNWPVRKDPCGSVRWAPSVSRFRKLAVAVLVTRRAPQPTSVWGSAIYFLPKSLGGIAARVDAHFSIVQLEAA